MLFRSDHCQFCKVKATCRKRAEYAMELAKYEFAEGPTPEPRNKFSPGYGGSFAKDVIGIVTKIDIATPLQIERAEKMLRMAGARKIFRISSYTGEGVQELAEYLAESPEEAEEIVAGLKLKDTKVLSVSKTSRK